MNKLTIVASDETEKDFLVILRMCGYLINIRKYKKLQIITICNIFKPKDRKRQTQECNYNPY